MLLGDRGSGIFIGRIGKGSEYDRSGLGMLCEGVGESLKKTIIDS